MEILPQTHKHTNRTRELKRILAVLLGSDLLLCCQDIKNIRIIFIQSLIMEEMIVETEKLPVLLNSTFFLQMDPLIKSLVSPLFLAIHTKMSLEIQYLRCFKKRKREKLKIKRRKLQKKIRKKINKIVSAVMNKEKDTMLLMMGNTLVKSSGNSNDSKIVEYLKYCAEEKVIPLPIMTNIVNGTLCLENYKLGEGICRALGRFLPGLKNVNKLKLVNNGLSDSGFADLLRGLCLSEQIKRLDCSGNAIGESSLLELGNILSRVGPEEQFEELSLNHTKISNLHLNQLLEVMGNNCPLLKLGISRLPCDEITVDWLSKILKKAHNLNFLDISGCEMLSIHLLQLLRILVRNRKLEYVNLSWLPLGSQGEMTMSSLKNEILILLCTFIAKNKQLVHLDLSYSRITDFQIKEILAYAIKSPSLMSLHLSGNAISEKFKTNWLAEVEGMKLEFDHFHSEYETEKLEKKGQKKEEYREKTSCRHKNHIMVSQRKNQRDCIFPVLDRKQ
eukprot:TRINITY_DN26210_c0_g1_i1.p1 TRINITY_DN26210_c0_g1~~TRINITY_DN26210_c0_g1_i1.p1  ORF type:complete len:503 (+),score=42.42 TRINITY_DN26210_c0_g1_i1:1010-2518(+)